MGSAAKPQPPSLPPLVLNITERIVRLPRLVRLFIAALIALAVTLLLTPLVDFIYLSAFFDRTTVIAPSLISSLVGVVVYVVGWRLIIGIVGETPPVRPVVVGYLLLGAMAVLLVLVLVVYGLVSASIYL